MRPRTALTLWLLGLAPGCRETITPRPAPLNERPPRPREVAPPHDAGLDAAADVSPSTAAVADARTWPFVAHARRWCLPDRLAATSYLVRWVPQFRGRLPPGDAVPDVGRFLPGQRAGADDPPTLDDQQRLLTWQSEPRVSHVMDCVLRVPIPGAGRDRSTTYAIYLPADYLDHPTRPRPIILLVSGGNGNRTRWFLTPARSDGETPGTGGLEVRRRVDAWAAAHPGAAVPIVVGLDGTSDQFPNGMWAFLEHELPDHLVATYLPEHPRARIPLGVECISSGCAELSLALRVNPYAFHAVGLLSPYVHPSGIDLGTTFGTGPQRAALFRTLAARHREGSFEMRFSVGNLDDHLPRARQWFEMLKSYGLFPSVESPAYSNCQMRRARPHSSHCTATWPGFWLYPNVAHHYRALIPAFPPALDWQLETLTAMVDRLQHGPRSPGGPVDGGAPLDAGVPDAAAVTPPVVGDCASPPCAAPPF